MEANTSTQKNTVATTHASLGLSVGQKSKRIFYYQLAAFFLTALVYSISHASRTVWGYAKPYLSTEDPYYTSGKLGFLDFSFMASYAIGQYISGWLGDRVDLKVFVCSGLTCAMAALCLFGCLEGFLLIDSLTIAMFLFIFNGFGQSTAYPGCISIVSNWFTSGKAGLIFGLWGTCLNIGDIIGQQIGSFIINEKGLSWQYALFTTAGIQIFLVIILAIFVKTSPKDLKNGDTRASDALIESPEDHQQNQVSTSHHGHGHGSGRAISFREALQIKNVSFFALGFFCVKGVIYGTMFWLPFYLTKEVGFEGNISLLLASIEIGMLIGSILLGYLSDRINSRAIMISFGFFFAVIFLVFTFLIKELKLKMLYFFLLLLAGVGIGGPASLIGGAVSSDLGQKFAEKNSVNAIATIAGIMEGCGALGAALTQLLVSNFTQITFPFFAFLCLVGGFVMVPVAIHDYRKIKRQQATGEEAESDQEAPRHVRF